MFFQRARPAESEASLFQRAVAWPNHPTLESLTPGVIQLITKTEGVDFATALLFDRFQRSSRHSPFIRKIDALRQIPPLTRIAMDAKVVIVPGALYLERPDM